MTKTTLDELAGEPVRDVTKDQADNLANQKKNLKDKILSIVNSLEHVDDEKDFRKEVCKDIKDVYGFKPRTVMKVAKLWHKNEKNKEDVFIDEVDSVYNILLE
jgi:3-methyladenine DNA glycosylase AlkC